LLEFATAIATFFKATFATVFETTTFVAFTTFATATTDKFGKNYCTYDKTTHDIKILLCY